MGTSPHRSSTLVIPATPTPTSSSRADSSFPETRIPLSTADKTAVLPPSRSERKTGGVQRALLAVLIVALAILGVIGIPRMLRPRTVAPDQSGVRIPPPPPQPPSPSTETPTNSSGKSTTAPATGETAPTAQSKPSANPASPNPAVMTLNLSARDNTNIIFRTVGRPTETLLMKAGDTVTLQAEKEATLTVSNADVLDAKLNGKEISFGTERRGGVFTITPEGVSPAIASVLPPVPGIKDLTDDRSGRALVRSPLRQEELMQSPAAVHLLIQSSALPEFVTVTVRMDNVVLFRRDATASVPANLEEGRRRGTLAAGPTAPLAEERLLPPGLHTLQVSLSLGATRIGQAQEVTSQFVPGQHRALLIQLVREPLRAGERGNPGRFTIALR
jgi:RodZ C-terminal domain